MNFKPTSPALSDSSSEDDEAIEQAPLSDALDQVLRVDRFRLKRLRKKLSAQEYQAEVQKSVQQAELRRAAQPLLQYPDELPISAHRDELVKLIRKHQVLVVCGETGSGKSTQLPKFCLEAGLGRDGMIGHTQPRRLAARSIATRLAEEVNTALGKLVGYQVRFGDRTSPETLVKLMTDGILLAETQSDRFLDAYDVIIIDEAHERSLNIDFLMGYIRRLQTKRPDLKIIITSATIDAERFAEHFADGDSPAPIVNVQGRGYPVEMRYLPWEDCVDDDGSTHYDLSRHIIAALQDLGRSGDGDTLVFLPTERDIREVSHRVAGHYKRMGLDNRVDLLPLYARLPQKEQQKIFQTGGGKRRVVFATNVAESSLTVPGIRYVIDSGTARISRYSPRCKLQRLPIEPISQASANQRSGRCGRVGPGICVRLYSADDFDARDAFTTPEIRRTNLASVVLQTKTLKLGPLAEFPLLDPPRPEAIREGVQTLMELGAIDDRQELTQIGWTLGRMPVDPRVGRIILAADEYGALAEVLPIAAALEIPDPRVRPPEKQQAADESHTEWADWQSDFLSLLRLWRYFDEAREEFSRNKLQRILKKRFLSPARMREWSDTYRQLKETAAKTLASSRGGRKKISKIQFADDEKQVVDDAKYAAIHQSLLTGLLSGVALLGDKHEYTGAGGLKLFLWPGSGIFDSQPKWIVAAELVETRKQYARTVAKIQPQWIEPIASHLCKRSYSDPHWSKKSSGSFCYERVSLNGLPIVVRRRVPLSPIDPTTARSLLIEHGLVEAQLPAKAKFLQHNRRLCEAIESLAAKTRRRDLVVDPYLLAKFYRERLPDEVCDRGRLEKYDRSIKAPEWTKKLSNSAAVSTWLSDPPASTGDDTGCYLRPEDVLDVASETVISQTDFPDQLQVGGSRLPLKYQYKPGDEDDGISLRIHQSALAQISDDRLGWLVPGLLETKLIAMIKSLPKRIRRNLVPAADVAAQIAEELKPDFAQIPFMPAVCQAMSKHAGMQISAHDFQPEKLEAYLDFLIQVVDDEGNEVARSRCADDVKRATALGATDQTAGESGPDDQDWPQDKMTDFEIDELPREVVRKRGGVRVAQYPAIVDQGDHVITALYPDLVSAEAATRVGVARLYAIKERKQLRGQVRWLPNLEQTKIKLAGAISSAEMETALIALLARISFVEDRPVVRTRDEFAARRENRGEHIAKATQDLAAWLGALSDNYFALRKQMQSTKSPKYIETVADVKEQLAWLMPPKFLSITPWQWLKHYPRYLEAIAYRLDKLRSGSASRDAEGMSAIRNLHQQWLSAQSEDQRSPESQCENEFRWTLEELRVSTFAQPLGTSIKVSVKRCEKLLAKSLNG